MPDPITHTSIAAAATGTFSAVLAFVFDVPAPVVFASFAGACFAVAMSPSLPLFRVIVMILMGTIAASYVTPMALHFFGAYPQRGAAFVLAFILLYFRDDGLNRIKALIANIGGAR